MSEFLKDLLLLAASRDAKARAAFRIVDNVRRFVRKSRKISREIEKLGGKR
jgi:hypothetical protein